jgi:HK97 family phage major capsid protein
MAIRLKELVENKGKLAAEIRRQADTFKAGETSPEQQSAWDKVNADYDENERLIAVQKRADAVAADGRIVEAKPQIALARNQNVGSDENRALAIAGWFCEQSGLEPTEAQEDAMRAHGLINRRGVAREELALSLLPTSQYRSAVRQFRSANRTERENLLQGIGAVGLVTSTADTPKAGYMIAPGQLVASLEFNLLAFGGMRQVAETIRTVSAEPLKWPSANDTSNTGEQVDEAASIGSSVDPTFGSQTWTAFKFSSKLIKFSAELLQDSYFDLPSVLGQMLGERLGRITNTRFTTGAGTTTAAGIVTGASSAFTAVGTTAVTADELIDLKHSIDPAYRALGGCGWMMRDATIKTLRKLKDGNGKYVWMDGSGNLTGGFSDTLLGDPVTVNQDVAAMTAGLKPILYGRFSDYKIRTVGEVRIRRLSELYAATDEEGMIAFIREDGQLLNRGTVTVKYITMA